MSNVKWRRGFFRLWVVVSVLWLFVAAGVTGFTGVVIQVGQDGFTHFSGGRLSKGGNQPSAAPLFTPSKFPPVSVFSNGANTAHPSGMTFDEFSNGAETRPPTTETPQSFSFEEALKPSSSEEIPGATIDFAALENERDRIPRDQYTEIAWSFVGLGAAVPMCFFILGCAVVWVLAGFSKRP